MAGNQPLLRFSNAATRKPGVVVAAGSSAEHDASFVVLPQNSEKLVQRIRVWVGG